jgi:hypothetical protein
MPGVSVRFPNRRFVIKNAKTMERDAQVRCGGTHQGTPDQLTF